jgi:CTP:molybdopterin cytidylyltransferase MocA
MGQPKQLALLAGETLLKRTLRLCREAGLEQVVVVLGAVAEAVARSVDLSVATVVTNDAWEEGMASSVRVGIESLAAGCTGCVIVTCDMPAVTSEHLRKLASCDVVTASSYADKKGVPAYFPASSFEELRQLQGDTGARLLLSAAPVVELFGGELDIDTPEDLLRARKIFS